MVGESMKKALHKEFWMEIRKSRARFISIFLIVTLGVAFFSGIQATAPDMRYSGDAFYDDSRLMDLKVIGTMGLTDDDLEALEALDGIEAAEGAWYADVFCGEHDQQKVVHVESLNTLVNQLSVDEGRLPEKADECFLDDAFSSSQNLNIGDVIQLREEEDNELLINRELTVVGIGSSPLYISYNRGNTTVGSGEINGFLYVLPENFDSEVYTQVYLEVRGARDLVSFTDAYDHLVDKVMDQVEGIEGVQCSLRYENVVSEAEEELADARQELEDGRKEAEEELADARKELEDGEKELADGKKEYEDGKQELADARQEIADGKKELADARKEIRDGKKELADAKKELEKGRQELADGWAEYEDGRQQLADAETELADGCQQLAEAKQKLADGQKEVDNGRAELQANIQNFYAQREQLGGAWQQYHDGEAELAAGEQELSAAQAQIESGKTELAAARAQLDQNEQDLAGLEGASLQASQAAAAAAEALAAAQAEYSRILGEVEAGNLTQEEADAAAANVSAAQSGYEQAAAQASYLESTLSEGRQALEQGRAELQAKEAELTAAESTIARKQQEIAAGKQQLQETYQTLAAAQDQLNAGEAQISAAQSRLDSAQAELDAGAAEIAENEKTISDGEAEIAENKAKLADAAKELRKGEQEIADGEKEIRENEKKLADGEKEIQENEQKIADGEKEIEENEQKLIDAKQELADAEKELADGWKEYEDGKKEAEEEIAEGEQEIADAEAEIADLEVPQWYIYDRSSLPEYADYGDNAERIRSLGQVFPVIFFLVAALICLTTMTRMVEEQRTQIGTLKALGYAKMDIASKYLNYALLATIGGSVFGMLIGEKLIPYVIISAYGTVYRNMAVMIRIDYIIRYALIASVASVFCTVGATFAACSKVLAETPASLMRPPTPKEGKRILLERIGIFWKHLSFTWKSSLRNLFRYKKRLFMTVFGIAGSMGLMLVGFGVRDSVGDIVAKQYGNLQRYDGTVISDSDASREEKEELSRYLEENTDIERFTRVQFEIVKAPRAKADLSVYIYVPEDTESFQQDVLLRNRLTEEEYSLTDEGVIVSEKTCTLLGIGEGDFITVERDEETYQAKVVGITENYMSHYIYMTPAVYEETFGEKPEFADAVFTMKDDKKEMLEITGGEILQYPAALSISYTKSIASAINRMLDTLGAVIVVLIVSAGLLAFVVLYNLNNINITERQRELATLKVLGFYDVEVSQYVLRENILLTLFGIIFGCGFGTILHRYVILTVEVDNIMFGRDIYPLSYLYCMIFTVVFASLINLVMHHKMKKIDMVESLKSVE